MHLAKKYLLSFLFIVSFGVLQFNTTPLISPAFADSTLLNQQNLLQESTANNYGTKPQDIKVIVLNLIKTALTFVGIIMVTLLIFAGVKYMMSNGNEAQTKEALGQIKALFVGLLIILASWSIVSYMLKWIVCSSTTSGASCASIWQF